MIVVFVVTPWACQSVFAETIVGWGNDDFGQLSNIHSGNDFVHIAAHGFNCLALRSDGSLVAWGSNRNGQLDNVPTSKNFKAIAVGAEKYLAIKSDGSLVAWGSNSWDQCNVPDGNDFVARRYSCK